MNTDRPYTPADSGYPAWLAKLGRPPHILGNTTLLKTPPIAIVGSRRCPGALLLAAAEWAEAWVIRGGARPPLAGGFQTPVEAEVLRRLLRGGSPALVLPARSLPRRLSPAQREALEAGRLLFASPFTAHRPTVALAASRNALLARMARAVIVLHAAPRSRTLAWCAKACAEGLPLYTFEHAANAPVFGLGARPLSEMT